MIKTQICDMLEIDYPIIQAAMGPFDTKDLAVAVASAGGFGMVSHPAPTLEDGLFEAIQNEEAKQKAIENVKEPMMAAIREVGQKTQGTFGVNFRVAPEQPGLADDGTIDESSASKFDLSTPQAAVQTYMRMFALGDYESGMACVNPDSYIYNVVHESVVSQPGDKAYNLILLYQSIDLDAMHPTIVEQSQTGTRVSYTITFKHDIAVEGMFFPAGSQRETDIVLVERDGKWLVDDF